MTRVALRGLLGRKFRALLTAFAIVLGVAMVSGTYILTDTIDKAFDTIFVESYAGTDAVVSARAPEISFQGDTAESDPVDAEVLEKVLAVPSVEAATGSIVDESSTKILDSKGKAINTQGAPSFGFGVDPSQSRFNPLKLVEGTWPTRRNEVVIDAGTADNQDYAVGDTVSIATLRPVEQFTISGIAQYGSVSSLGTATFAVFTIPTAQELLDRKGAFDAISVAAKEGVEPQQLVRDIQPVLPSDAQVRTGTQQAGEDSEEITEFTSFIRYFLLAFAGIALFVGAFVIFNTLSITVAQRTRELATLRTLGASRRQVLGSVVLEALVIGLLASLAGLSFGVGLAYGLSALFDALNLGLPQTEMVFATRTVVVSILLGVIVTLVAGFFPGLKATRVPPISAVREGATLPAGRFARFTPYVAIGTIALALALLVYSMFVEDVGVLQRLLAIAGGTLTLFVGVALISPRTVPWLAATVGPIARALMLALGVLFYPIVLGAWLVRRGLYGAAPNAARRALWLVGGLVLLLAVGPGILFGLVYVLGFVVSGTLVWILFGLLALLEVVLAAWLLAFVVLRLFHRGEAMDSPTLRPDPASDKLSGENSRRNPGRTAATAAALMIGLALVTFVSVLANGMKQSNRGAIERQIVADYVVTSQDGYTPFVAAAGEAAAETEGAELVTSVRSELGKVAGSGRYVTGIDPAVITQVYRFDWVEGSDDVLGTLGRNGAIVDKDFAEEKKLEIGDTVPLLSSSEKRAQLEVKAIYKPPPFYPLLGSVSIPTSTFDSLYERPRNQYTFVNMPGDPTKEGKAPVVAAVESFPDARVQTREEWITKEDEEFNDFLTMLYVLLALSVIVSIFGMVNTLVLSVFERTRELGMLRAVGMTRKQVRRMVRHESVITALIGAALGLPLGMFLAALVTKALSQYEIEYAVPLGSLIVFGIVAAAVGVLAAILPARRAARLNVLNALQYE